MMNVNKPFLKFCFVLLLFLGVAEIGMAQTLAPGQPVPSSNHNKPIKFQSATAATCGPDQFSPVLPLRGRSIDDVECFYSTSNMLSPLNQIGFLYGFGQQTKSLSADLVSITFPFGLQTSLGTSVTSSTPDTSGNAQSGKDSPTQAIERLKTGGDFYIKGVYPLIYKNTTNFTGTVLAVPKLGFSFSGFGSEATITEATEYNVNTSAEAYAEYRAIKNLGAFYADLRSGWQWVQADFAQAVGLGDKQNFALSQFAGGLEIRGFMRIGFQRYFGPAQVFNITNSELSKWHLVLQL